MNTKAIACRLVCKMLGRKQRKECRAIGGICKAMETKLKATRAVSKTKQGREVR